MNTKTQVKTHNDGFQHKKSYFFLSENVFTKRETATAHLGDCLCNALL